MDVLGLRVTAAPGSAGAGFQVEVFVNGVEMTSAGAGLGMDPYDLLVPENRLVATDEPHTVPIARCTCGEYGCGSTDVTISRHGDVVHWDWQLEVPMDRRVTFAADAYQAEVVRAGSTFDWETPDRTAGRLVLSSVDRAVLAARGFQLHWAANDWARPGRFLVSLMSDRRQVLVGFAWDGRTPEELAAEVRRVLETEPPSRWWRATGRG